jgi:hypothetical protein
MRRPLIGAKGFQSFHWTRGTSSRKVIKEENIVCFGKKKRGKRIMKCEKGY